MLGPIFTGLTGLLAFAKGLDVISNNATNLNTPGFRGDELLFRDLLYRKTSTTGASNDADQEIGLGVSTRGVRTRDRQGEIQSSANQLDAAINGKGFFVFDDGTKKVLSRVGQFKFDADGILIDGASERPVLGLLADKSLGRIDISPVRISLPKATTRVSFTNNLSSGAAEHTPTNVTVFDKTGKSIALNVRFINTASTRVGSWRVEVKDPDNKVLLSNGELRFTASGAPDVGFNSVTFVLSPGTRNASFVELFMGDPGSLSNVTSFSAGVTSSMSVKSQDGFGLGTVQTLNFATDGTLTTVYTNGQSGEIGQLALAMLGDESRLRKIGDAQYEATQESLAQFSAPGSRGTGEIAGGSIELSNVELSQEFTDLIIVQRGFQSASQILSVTNEMLQQLIEMGRK